MKEMTVKISRYNPDIDQNSSLVEYKVKVNEEARVLHVLEAVHRRDQTFAFRSDCRNGQCGSCAVRVNGKPVLACMEVARDGMKVEPLNLHVIRDLEVDLIPGINQIPRINPDRSILPDKEDVDRIWQLRRCIECLACVSVCPVAPETGFIGPTAMRGNMRIALDPRDSSDRTREAVLSGLFSCTNCRRCWRCCPKDIHIPEKVISRLREMVRKKTEDGLIDKKPCSHMNTNTIKTGKIGEESSGCQR